MGAEEKKRGHRAGSQEIDPRPGWSWESYVLFLSPAPNGHMTLVLIFHIWKMGLQRRGPETHILS